MTIRTRVLASALRTGRAQQLAAREVELDAAMANLEAAAERAHRARWRVLLAVGRLRQACRLSALVADSA